MTTMTSLPISAHPEPVQKMRRYFEKPEDELSILVEAQPVCIYFEVTNRCNLLCTTCPRTFEELEPEKDMSWELFAGIVDQAQGLKRAVLHGVGEPMLVKNLPEMVRYLKDRGVYVLFNTNGTLLNERNGQALIDAGLDELRVSLDAAEPTAFQMVRGKDMFERIVTNVRRFRQMQQEQNVETPRVSLWLTGLRETLDQLEGFVRIAESVNVREIYLQRMVFFSDNGKGLARAESALFERTTAGEEEVIQRAGNLAASLGIVFNASGATEPGTSIKKRREDSPWSLCRRPWTLMYFTANGRALPCCIAPFSMHGYDSFTLGDASQQTLREIWNGPQYQQFRGSLMGPEPPRACANCGLRWSL
jgi:MoaA/NifB/PqqE/SkfB family radical SAM enzyme